MSCINFPRIIYCENPTDRIDRDIKKLKEELGIDLTKYRESFFAHSLHYVIEIFPRLIGSINHTKYNLAIYLSKPHEFDKTFVINTKRKTFRMITRDQHKTYAAQWLREAEVERAEEEKNEWREKLKSVGVNVQW